jgi:Ca2+-binding EF-hand superfamily protein
MLSDPAKLEPIIAKSFVMFDKDKSGFVEGPEVMQAVDKVLSMAGIAKPHHTHLEAIFNKVSGPDHRLDKAEFQRMVHELLTRLNKHPNPAAPLAHH